MNGFSGDRCQINVACNSAPCRNGGQCIDNQLGYLCRCADGWTGFACDRKTFFNKKTLMYLIVAVALGTIIFFGFRTMRNNVEEAEFKKMVAKQRLVDRRKVDAMMKDPKADRRKKKKSPQKKGKKKKVTEDTTPYYIKKNTKR